MEMELNKSCIVSIIVLIALFALANFGTLIAQESRLDKEVEATMRVATDFMMNKVANRGGFLWKYSADLSEQWGEVPARRSQIWVQPPGTASVGSIIVKAFQVTKDHMYLNYARQVAEALIWGQHPSGGWHYFIDFDPEGLDRWYNEVASRCWGWEEYYHYYDNATFDDEVTISASRFLLELYLATQDPKYKTSLEKALDFILESQYSNGAWPQRYPIQNTSSYKGYDDYTSYYTFNDDVIHANIMFLLEAYEKLGDERYQKAAYRGMNFYLLSQGAPPQAGWALQYDLELKPAWARTYEPASFASGQTVSNIRDLQTFYQITGNEDYLKPIPAAIQWLDRSIINTDSTKNFTHATFYEPGSNMPLYAHREGTSIQNGRYWVDHEPTNFPGHYGMLRKVDLQAIKKEFERISALPYSAAQAELRTALSSEVSLVDIDTFEIEKIISTLDSRGAWLEDLHIPHYPDVVGHPIQDSKGN